MRKLAAIRKIDNIKPIEGADAIECAVVGGWTIVVKKGEYQPGDMAVYCEIDSWIPTELAPFLSKGQTPRVYEGVAGERLRTIKLRGQLSQGLLLPLTTTYNGKQICVLGLEGGEDVTEILGIQKYEAPVPAQLAGEVRGVFPSVVPKTDQERCQNLVAEIAAATESELQFEITEKLEGSSCTMFLDMDGDFHVCSRNLDLKRNEDNSLWRAAIKYNVEQKMREADLLGFAIQGELVGPGIQGNIYKLKDIDFFVFDVYDVRGGAYLTPSERRELVKKLELNHVPVLASKATLYDTLGIVDISQLIKFANGRSVLGTIDGPLREGIVFKQVDGGMTFKVISNNYLLGEK